MKILAGPKTSPLVIDWIARRMPPVAGVRRGEDFGPATAIGVCSDDEREMLGGVIYHGYRPTLRSIEMSFASAGKPWLTKTIINYMMSYPFDGLGCVRITAITPQRNKRALKFIRKFGFRHEGTVRKGYGAQNAILSGLLANEWRSSRFYIATKNQEDAHGQAEPAHAA